MGKTIMQNLKVQIVLNIQNNACCDSDLFLHDI